MSEISSSIKSNSISIPAPEGVSIEQTSTRGDGSVELGEAFKSESVDFSRVVDHLGIHIDGEVAGSQFNGEIFATPEDVIEGVGVVLPETLEYDQHGRTELTIAVEGGFIGYSGVKPISELEGVSGVRMERGMRTPGGEAAEVDGVKGAWFPEMARNSETGRFEIALDPAGAIKNPYGKFEPEAWIAYVDEGSLPQALATDKVTVILQKNPDDELPVALTIFPGENAPPFPAKIESTTFSVDTLQGGPEAAYWAEHAFIQSS